MASIPPALDDLKPEKVAYWYFRLNGFFQIENFVVHPPRRGGQRTDADLLGVRFPYHAERLFDDPADIMADDKDRLSLSQDHIDAVIVEVKTNQPCALNGPWTEEERQNVHRVIAVIGCFPPEHITNAAAAIYREGVHQSELGFRIRLVAVGRTRSEKLATDYPKVTQLVWRELLEFIWHRFHRYRRQKTQVDQWDADGLKIKGLADAADNPRDFTEDALRLMGVQTRD